MRQFLLGGSAYPSGAVAGSTAYGNVGFAYVDKSDNKMKFDALNELNIQYNKIDIEYLENNNYDNIPLLISLKKKCKDNYLKDEIDFYLKERYQEIKKEKIVEKNLSSIYAESLLK